MKASRRASGWKSVGERGVRNPRSSLLTLALSVAVALPAAEPLAHPDEALAGRQGGVAYSIEVTGVIDRSAQLGLERALAAARDRRASVAIVRLDTPGGLIEDTREMAKDIIAAPMPVIVYVHPSGAHAESAGLFVTLAGDVAAMAPGTNIGSATPFLLAPTENREQRGILKILQRKLRNDAIAWARALAEEHDRNAELAARMVSDAVNVSARQAKRQRLIDVLATSERALLRQLDGFRLKGQEDRELRTAGLAIEHEDIENEPVGPGGSGDDFALVRPLAIGLVVVLAIGFGLPMLARTRGLWRRRRWLWRRWRAKRRQRRRRR